MVYDLPRFLDKFQKEIGVTLGVAAVQTIKVSLYV